MVWTATKCVDVDADADAVDEPCMVYGGWLSGLDSCAKGAICINVDPRTSIGTCVGLCVGNEWLCLREPMTCCTDGKRCEPYGDGSPYVLFCVFNCDPILQNCKGSGQSCYPSNETFRCAPDVSGDMGAVGDPCEYTHDCDPGTFCGDPDAYPGCDPNAPGCCIPFCSLMAPECTMGTECLPWYDPKYVKPGYEDLGACVIP